MLCFDRALVGVSRIALGIEAPDALLSGNRFAAFTSASLASRPLRGEPIALASSLRLFHDPSHPIKLHAVMTLQPVNSLVWLVSGLPAFAHSDRQEKLTPLPKRKRGFSSQAISLCSISHIGAVVAGRGALYDDYRVLCPTDFFGGLVRTRETTSDNLDKEKLPESVV